MPDRPHHALTGIAVVLLTLIGWSSVPLFLKHFTGSIDFWTANGWRYSIAAAIWFPAILYAWRRGTLSRSLWIAAVLPSIFNALGQGFFAAAPYYIDPGLMTFALRVQIVFIAAGAAILFAAERRIVKTPGFLGGAALVLLGTSGTLLFKPGSLGAGTTLGVVIAITSGLFYACYALSVRHSMRGTNPLTAFAVISQYTAILLIPPMLLIGERSGAKVLELSTADMGWLALSAIIGIGLGHTFYYISIERLGVAATTGVIQLQPFLVTAASVVLFDEVMTPAQLVSGGIAICGAGLILYTQHRLARADRAPAAIREFKDLPIDADVAAAVAGTETPPKPVEEVRPA